MESDRCDVEGYEYVNVVRGGRYKTVSHYLRGGRRRYCYIGPVDVYVHAVRLHGIGIGHAFNIENIVSNARRSTGIYECNKGECSKVHGMEVIIILWQGLRKLGFREPSSKDHTDLIQTFMQEAMKA